VRVVRRLHGGTHAVTLLLDPEMVLQQFPPGDDAPIRTATVLKTLDGLGGWAPRLLGVDPARGFVLLTMLPGTADIMPRDPGHAAGELGRGLARIHATPPPGLRRRHSERWPDAEHVLSHYDYWSGNVLWKDGDLTGIVDWSGASLAPRGFDVAWCRLDLVLLHGPSIADAFLEAYELAAGIELADRLRWDLLALADSRERVETWEPNYTSLGRTDLTGAELRARHTRWRNNLGE
jgi:aminoglycoside/choline kinase family phosphotransferase